MIVAGIVAVVAALLFALASVLQQRAASEVSDADARGTGLIRRLLRRPLWLAGTASDTLGYVAQAAALGVGSLVLVQPLLATSLLFALPLGAWVAGRRLARRDAVWAALLTAGLAVFLIAGEPTEGADSAPFEDWVVPGAIVLAATAVALLVAVRRRSERAVALAVATGILFGATAALTKSVVSFLDDGLEVLLGSWETYALVAVAVAGTYLQQASYQAGGLAQTLPPAAVLEPVVGVGLGMAVLQEELRADGGRWLLIALSAVTMIVATAALARAQGEASGEAPGAPGSPALEPT
jgi:drug/metabolite transporter (DMT)-like permease